jgi:hypothetical protein
MLTKNQPRNPLNQNVESMKTFILTIIASVSVLASAFAQSVTINQTVTPTLTTTSQTFTFNLFDSDLGTLTAVNLLLNSSVAGGSVSLTTDAESAIFDSFTSRVRTSGTGLAPLETTAVPISLNPGLPNPQSANTLESYYVTGSQSLISSVQTYAINSLNWASYQTPGGAGNTPNFSARTFATQTLTTDGSPVFISTLYTAASSYTLRYTYTPGPAPIPEPGQVAASLLLLSGIGAYVFIKRRKKSAPAAA